MGARWLKIAVIYFILGIGIGLYMSYALDLRWGAAHAHVNLAGWASIAIIGLIYSVYPKAGNNTLGIWSFWLYNLGMPVLLASMFMVQMPGMLGFAHTFTFTGGGAVLLGVILITINVFQNVKEENLFKRE